MLPMSGAALSRLRLALAPHWGALLALALFLVAGLAVLDDYGVTGDEFAQRINARGNLDYLSGDIDSLPSGLFVQIDRFFGVGFEAVLLLAEDAFGIDENRSAYLFRHLLMHLFFLVGGAFAYLLALRLFRSRLLAAAAAALFLLHPRIYAHSFFNSKDIPFLVMFLIALYLAHRAFRRDTAPAFALLGAAAGALLHLRIMGVLLFAAILAMRALDFAFASNWAERKRVAAPSLAFLLAGTLATYTLLPYFWADPVGRSAEWWSTLTQRPPVHELFQGTVRSSVDLPASYVPVWFSVTTPPFALLLGLIGAAVILGKGIKRPGAALRNTRLRFAALLIGCFALPVIAVALLNSNVFNGWRHLYFLWAPFSLAAVYGLRHLLSAFPKGRLRAAIYGSAAVGAAATVVGMTFIHPNEQVYFNALVDRTTPERLRTQYVMDYWSNPVRQAWEILIREHPAGVAANPARYHSKRTLQENADILPDAERERISMRPSPDAFVIKDVTESRFDLALRRLSVYGNTILTIERKEDLRMARDSAAGDRILDSVFDLYRSEERLLIVKEPCAESYIANTVFYLHLTPESAEDLPPGLRAAGRENLRFRFGGYGALFDDACIASIPLPDYALADIKLRWEPALMDDAQAREKMRRALTDGRLLARSVYDFHLAGDELVYIQSPCVPAQTERRFFLHVVPEREEDLPAARREFGFANRNFDFYLNGALLDGACVAAVPLPDYPAASIRTGQFVSGEGEIWSAEFEVSRN